MSKYYQTIFLTSGLTDISEKNDDFLTIQDKIEEVLSDCIHKSASLNINEYKIKFQKLKFLEFQTDINMNYLASMTGKNLFDTTMFNFFEKYKKSHITPEIFHSFLDTNLKTDHTWFFDGAMNDRGAFAYRIESVRKEGNQMKIKVNNNGPFAMPYKLELLDSSIILNTINEQGHIGMKEFTFNQSGGNKIVIDRENTILKSRTSKTLYFIKNRFKNLELFNFYRNTGPTHEIYPMIGYNKHDEFLIGTYIRRVDDRKFNGNIFAFYGTGSESFVSDFNLSYNSSDCCTNNFLSLHFSGATYHRNKGKILI
ncbi:MAG: hypothetical protein IPH57_16755 [Saprospiraceae bacterium]|nr:hypothetical protein [Saprospiraceae bacterium]